MPIRILFFPSDRGGGFGHATMMETISEQLGCGHVLKLSNESFERVNARWPFEKYSHLVQRRYDLATVELRSTAYGILNDIDYSINTKALQRNKSCWLWWAF